MTDPPKVKYYFHYLKVRHFINKTLKFKNMTHAIIITWEHFVVTVKNISRVNLAFATMNGLASIIFAIFTIISFYF